MDNNPLSPNYLKGAFIALYPDRQFTRITTFQLNPDSLQRDILPLGKKVPVYKTAGVRERISFDLSVDALLGDGYFDDNGVVNPDGVIGFLSSLELLLHPAEASNQPGAASSGSSLFGFVDFVKALLGFNRYKPLPLVSLVFGEHRIIPVRITKMRIQEQAFDTTLNPVQASVHLVMETLTEQESKHHPQIEGIYKNYLQHKVLTADNLQTNVAGISVEPL